MRRLAKSLSPMLWMLAFALLIVVRTSDAHVHLCFDGQEPPSSLHFEDTPGHHQAEDSQAAHQDQDVDAVNPALVKKAAQAADIGPLPVVAVVLMLLPPDRGVERAITQRDPAPKLPYLFLPLLRGPPA
jgi:hypothetical protein